jgi:hypothetical protein
MAGCRRAQTDTGIAMKIHECGRYVKWGLAAGLVAWTIFIATLIYAALFVPDVPAQANQLFTQRGGMQAGGFIAGWWLAMAALALCVLGYLREYKGPWCLLGVVPAALYVANPWSVMVFVKFIGG